MRDKKLSSNFKLSEFIVSSSFPNLLKDVELKQEEVQKFHYLTVFCLQPLRNVFGPIVITSGYRTRDLNKMLIGASSTSQHLMCEAVDFVVVRADGALVYEALVEKMKWPGQVIYYEHQDRFHVGLPRINLEVSHSVRNK